MTRAPGSPAAPSAIDSFAAAVMILLTFLWGLNHVAVKVSNLGYNPIFSVLVRSAIGCVLVFLWCRLRGIALFNRDGTFWPGVLAGVLFGIEFVLIFIGFDYTTAARGTLMFNAMPFWVLLGGHFLVGERITRQKFAGLLMAFGGVALILSDEASLPGPGAVWGDLMCLAAGMLWAAITLVIKGSSLSDASPEKTLLYQLFISMFVVAPLVPFAGPMLRDVTLLATGALLFQAVIIVSVTFLVWFWLIRRYSASGLSSFAFLTPAFAVILSGLLLNEPLSVRVFAALALIVAGLLVVNRQARPAVPL